MLEKLNANPVFMRKLRQVLASSQVTSQSLNIRTSLSQF